MLQSFRKKSPGLLRLGLSGIIQMLNLLCRQ